MGKLVGKWRETPSAERIPRHGSAHTAVWLALCAAEEAKKEAAEAGEEAPAGIPDFWSSALSNHPAIEEQVGGAPRAVLGVGPV